MLPKFSVSSQRRMCRRILDARHALDKYGDENVDAGARHIFREFIPAAELNGVGFSFEYEERVDGLTPDWIDRNAGMLVEVPTHWSEGERRRGQTESLLQSVASATNTVTSPGPNALRVVIAIYLDFLTGVTLRECKWQCGILGKLFGEYPELTGLLFFAETNVPRRNPTIWVPVHLPGVIFGTSK